MNASIFKSSEYWSDEYRALFARLEALEAELRRNAWTEFVNFDHAKSFFSEHPIEKDERAFFGRNKDAALAFVSTLNAEQASTFAKSYGQTIGADEELRGALGLRFFAKIMDGPSPPSLQDLLAAVQASKQAGLTLKEVPGLKIGFVEVTSKTLLKEGQIEFPVALELDVPFKASKEDLDSLLDYARRESLDFVVAIDVAQANVSRRVLGRIDNDSQFVSGTRLEHNPDYDLARSRVVEVQGGLMNAQSQASYGAAAAILQGVAIGMWRARLDEARNQLLRTPPQVSKEVFQRYKYNVSEVDVSRKLTANYYVIDRNKSNYWKGTVDSVQTKTFRIAYNVHDADPEKGSILRRFSTEEELARFEQAPMAFTASAFLEDYVKNQAQVRNVQSIASLRSEITTDKNKALVEHKGRQFDAKPVNDARFDSVVMVMNPKGSLGSGFYIAPDLVLTNFHVIDGARFVEMRLFNGTETFGKVVKSDVRLDLALVKVEARGVPVEFYEGQTLPLGANVEAIGHPRGLSFTLTRGIVSAVRKRPSVYAVGGKDVMFVQTDAAINPGNSGGPLFLAGKVVGVNNNKMVQGAEGLGFAIHYSEVKDFLAEVLK